MIALAALALAAVFAVAGTAKIRDRAGTRDAIRAFGVPTRAATPVAVLLPVAELAVAGGLVIGPFARVAAGAAAGLLLVFTAALALALARGRRPSCGCFGGSHAPAGRGTLGRNAVLAALAVVVVVDPPLPGGWRAIALSAAAVVLAAQTALLVTVLRRYGNALRRLDELEVETEAAAVLEVGSLAPSFALPATDGRPVVTLEDLLAPGPPALLLFTATGCAACNRLLPDIARWQTGNEGRLTVAVVGHGDPSLLAAEAAEHGVQNVLVAQDRAVSDAYGAYITPSAVVVDGEGRVASPVVHGVSELWSLLEPSNVRPAEVAHA